MRFRKKLPLTLRSALYPVIGERIYGPIGHGVDLLAVFGTVFGTVFGVATSLGLGVKQMAAGLEVLFGVAPTLTTQILLIAVISAVATLSAVSGVARGIRIISEWNIYLSIVLLAFFLFFGPFEWLMGLLVTSLGAYVWNAVPMGFWTAAEPGEAAWQSGWTIFYWGWWISWAPFVGLFIARISRGRTIREFMAGTLFVPTAVGILWICLFGGNALYMELNAEGGAGTAGILELVRGGNLEAALYGTIARLSDISWLTWSVSALATFPPGDLVHHLFRLGHPGDRHHAQHGRRTAVAPLPRLLGQRHRHRRYRAAARRRVAGAAGGVRRGGRTRRRSLARAEPCCLHGLLGLEVIQFRHGGRAVRSWSRVLRST